MNEYQQKFEKLNAQSSFKGQQWFGKRQELVEKYSWAIPNDEVLSYISRFDEIVEAGAGNGYWAHLLEKRGTQIYAFDRTASRARSDERWTDVSEATVFSSRDKIKDMPCLLVWPPTNKSMASEVLSSSPSHILYVGEQQGGCTATDTFFERLGSEYGLVKRISIPSYEGVSDDFYHYVRNI
jgi:hypothetical protein